LVHNSQFRIDDAFHACDLKENGTLDVDVLKTLLERAGSMRGINRVTEAEARNLAFKFDRNRDQRVHFEEFAVELQPKSHF
jgi:Ca2+-binding EF-hand superfamily protein